MIYHNGPATIEVLELVNPAGLSGFTDFKPPHFVAVKSLDKFNLTLGEPVEQ